MYELIGNIFDYIKSLYNEHGLDFFTLVIVSFYTFFTYRLWRENVRQTELNLMPIPSVYIRKRNNKDIFRIRNLGYKPLVNINIEKWNLFLGDDIYNTGIKT